MSSISSSEMRYAAISFFGLIIFTTFLKWTGLGKTRYKPLKPDTSNATQLNDSTFLNNLFDPSIGSGSSAINTLIDVVITPIQLFVDLLLTWSAVWDAMSFTSIFIIVPMFIMLAILVSFIIVVAQTFIP